MIGLSMNKKKMRKRHYSTILVLILCLLNICISVEIKTMDPENTGQIIQNPESNQENILNPKTTEDPNPLINTSPKNEENDQTLEINGTELNASKDTFEPLESGDDSNLDENDGKTENQGSDAKDTTTADNEKEGDNNKSILSDKSDELGKIKGEIKKEQNNELAISIIIISSLILLNNFLIDKINILKKKCKCLEFLQNPLVTLLLGIISGVFVKIFEANSIIQTIKSGFQEFFMIILLPPILFASALNMNKFYFFKNFGKILILSFIGTFIAILVNTGLLFVTSLLPWGTNLSIFQCIIFSVLISATDPVSVLITFEGYSCNPNLYSLIFGESILNDAITLALYRSLRSNQGEESDSDIMKDTLFKFILLIIGSSLIAIVVGFFISFIMKKIYERVQSLDDKINFTRTVLESSKFENLNFQTMEDSERQKKINYDLIKINSLIQKKNNLVSRQTSLMMISPLMAYLVAEVSLLT